MVSKCRHLRPFRSPDFWVENFEMLILTRTLARVHHVSTKFRTVFSLMTDSGPGGEQMSKLMHQLWSEESGQDIAEYAVMLAVILVLVVGTVRLIGSNSNSVFSQAASSIQ
jgi:Flp pilus assembly pilin Flp